MAIAARRAIRAEPGEAHASQDPVPLPACAGASLAAPVASAQTAAPATATVDPATIQALKDLGAHLQSLQRFRVTNELTGERVLTDGQKLQHMASATLDVQRPNRLRVKMSSARSQRELFYDGKQATLYTPAQKYYATVPFTGSLGDLADALQAKYGVELPLADLFVLGTPAAPLDKVESAMNAGQDFVGDDLCDHYALRQGNFDWQIWITAGQQAAAPQAGHHEPRRRGPAAVGEPHRLGPEAGPGKFGVHLQAAPGREGHRDRAAQDAVKEHRHEEVLEQAVPGRAGPGGAGRLHRGSVGRGGARRRWWAVVVAAEIAPLPVGGGGGGNRAAAAPERNVQASNANADKRTNDVRNTSANNVNVNNKNVNNNVNVNKNVNVNVEGNGGCCNNGWDNDYHPIATAAAVTATVAVIGSMVRTVPPNCAPVSYGGMVYQQCGGTWYQPQGSQYIVVNPPY
jgi:hypothetical protein